MRAEGKAGRRRESWFVGGAGIGGRRTVMGEDDDRLEPHEFRHLYGDEVTGGVRPQRNRAVRARRLRLYTATIASTQGNVMVQAFHASIARSSDEVRARLAGRFGPHLADAADIRVGVNRASPLVVALVPPAVVEMIDRVEWQCEVEAARGFAIDIQQCIHG